MPMSQKWKMIERIILMNIFTELWSSKGVRLVIFVHDVMCARNSSKSVKLVFIAT
jgi:hypothetical protein